jgi:predicted RNA binding protein YcfA (HicA-like mRNA interferase family)
LIYHAQVNGKQVIARLKAHGWALARTHGSHHILVKDDKAVPVPVHGTRDLGPGLLAAIQRQTGVKLK